MNILVLGGTGTMGVALTSLLENEGHNVFVTSRSNHKNKGLVTYIKGNAKNLSFLNKILPLKKWDSILDFMMYSTKEFEERYQILLNSTSQYIFMSSARVYSNADEYQTEATPRLLEYIKDEEYLATDEYALNKAREENLLLNSGSSNYTIIRPGITYGTYRMQLGVLEKEEWLYRALEGKPIIISGCIASKYTTMTFNEDSALCIFRLVGNPKAHGEIFNITTDTYVKWMDVLNIYADSIEKNTGKRPDILITKEFVAEKNHGYQVTYDRVYDRKFDNKKIADIMGADFRFSTVYEKLPLCISEFISRTKFLPLRPIDEAIKDRYTRSFTKLSVFKGWRNKVKYLLYRLYIKK